MNHLGWNPCRADRDLWMKAETRPDDGVLYWAYFLIYVDEILCVHHDHGSPLAKLDEYFKMKEGSIQVPSRSQPSTWEPNWRILSCPMTWLHGAWAPASSWSLLSRMSRNIWQHSLVIRCWWIRYLAHLLGYTSLSLMRVPSWTIPEQTSTNHRL
jgi:hypothetical protein